MTTETSDPTRTGKRSEAPEALARRLRTPLPVARILVVDHEPYETADENTVCAGCACGWVAEHDPTVPGTPRSRARFHPNTADGVRAAADDFDAHLNTIAAKIEWFGPDRP